MTSSRTRPSWATSASAIAPGRGGEVAAEVEDDGVGGEDTAIEKLGDAVGVGGGDPERTEGGGLGGWIGRGGELPGSGGALPEAGGGVRREEEVGGRGVVAQGAAGDGSAGVDAEMEAGAGLGLVAVEEAEVFDVGGVDLGSGGLVADGDEGDRGLPGGRRRARGGSAARAFGDGEAVGAGGEEGLVELAGFEGGAGGVLLVEGDVGADVAAEAAAVDDVAGGDVDVVGGWHGGGDLEASEEGAVAVVSEAGEDALAGSGADGVGVFGGDDAEGEAPGEAGGGGGRAEADFSGADGSGREGRDVEASGGADGGPVDRLGAGEAGSGQSSSRGGRPAETMRPVAGFSAWMTRRRSVWSGPVFWITNGMASLSWPASKWVMVTESRGVRSGLRSWIMSYSMRKSRVGGKPWTGWLATVARMVGSPAVAVLGASRTTGASPAGRIAVEEGCGAVCGDGGVEGGPEAFGQRPGAGGGPARDGGGSEGRRQGLQGVGGPGQADGAAV